MHDTGLFKLISESILSYIMENNKIINIIYKMSKNKMNDLINKNKEEIERLNLIFEKRNDDNLKKYKQEYAELLNKKNYELELRLNDLLKEKKISESKIKNKEIEETEMKVKINYLLDEKTTFETRIKILEEDIKETKEIIKINYDFLLNQYRESLVIAVKAYILKNK